MRWVQAFFSVKKSVVDFPYSEQIEHVAFPVYGHCMTTYLCCIENFLNVERILPARLESLLELALRTSTANADPFKDDLKFVDLC